jgi:TonB-dependent SusC/RagA subfamily outer membrane receptor
MKNTTVIAKTPGTVIARNSLSRTRFGKATSELCRSRNGYIVLCNLPFLLAFLFCLLLSVNALAQSADSSKKDTSKGWSGFRDNRSLPNPTKPLIVLDGVPYFGIPNPADIKQISLLKANVATALYGSQAALGVIFVTTKNDKGYWSLNNPDKTNDLFIDTNALYIMDGKVSANKLNGINTGDIFDIKILKYDSTQIALTNPNRGQHDVVIICTQKGAIKSYQKKFSTFSKDYKEYLASNNNDDRGFLYLINGVSLDQIYIDYGIAKSDKTWEGIRKLYNVPVEKIKKISFLDNNGTAIGKKIVVIKTKK